MDTQQGIAILTNIDKNIQLIYSEFVSLRKDALVPLMNAFNSKNEFDRNIAKETVEILKNVADNIQSQDIKENIQDIASN